MSGEPHWGGLTALGETGRDLRLQRRTLWGYRGRADLWGLGQRAIYLATRLYLEVKTQSQEKVRSTVCGPGVLAWLSISRPKGTQKPGAVDLDRLCRLGQWVSQHQQLCPEGRPSPRDFMMPRNSERPCDLAQHWGPLEWLKPDFPSPRQEGNLKLNCFIENKEMQYFLKILNPPQIFT